MFTLVNVVFVQINEVIPHEALVVPNIGKLT